MKKPFTLRFSEHERSATRKSETAAGPPLRSVSESFAALLSGLGVEVAYGLIGGSIVPLCDALARSGIRMLHCRHESGAAFAALEDSLASSRLTVLFATSGPGLTNTLTGLCSARSEGAKVVLLSGGTAHSRRERGASQETTAKTLPADLFAEGPIFHYATIVEDASQLAAVFRRIALGATAPAGFVAHIHLPLSVQSAQWDGEECVFPTASLPMPHPDVVEDIARILRNEPCALWIGFGARFASAQVRALLEALPLPVMCSPRAKGIVPEDHPLFLGVTGVGGHPRVMEELLRLETRRTLVLGSRLWECTSFWDPRLSPKDGFLHVDLDPTVFGAAYPSTPTIGIVADIGAFLTALLDRLSSPACARPELSALAKKSALLPRPDEHVRAEFLFESIQRVIVEASNAMVLTEAGNAFVWGSHVLRFREPFRYRVGLHFGSMGHATTGAIGAARARGERVFAVVGDGAMLMLSEVSTAVRYELPVVWVVLNDSRYGIVEHGMRASGYMPVETALPETDFAMIARGMGAQGVRVVRETDVEGALLWALSVRGPAVVDVRIDPDERAPISSRFRSLEAQGIPRVKESVP